MNDVYIIDTDHAAWTRTGDQIVVLDLRTSSYLATNDTAEVLWSALVDGADLQTLADALRATFDVDPDLARRDAAAFVGALVDQGLVRVARAEVTASS